MGGGPHLGLHRPQRDRLFWHLFEPLPLYDEIAHLLTPLVLVAITAEIIYRSGGDDELFDTPRHAIVTGSNAGSWP